MIALMLPGAGGRALNWSSQLETEPANMVGCIQTQWAQRLSARMINPLVRPGRIGLKQELQMCRQFAGRAAQRKEQNAFPSFPEFRQLMERTNYPRITIAEVLNKK
jgi:hypothetical protein